jgi:hypothetical protein
MGGNPLTQFEIINDYRLYEEIRDYDSFIISFCAGSINLSKYSLISTDSHFNQYDYIGIGRINFCIEPCCNKTEESYILQKKNSEIQTFANKYKTKVIALPDESIIVVEDNKLSEFGPNYQFNYGKYNVKNKNVCF